jgi:anti-sigma factor RsiW
VKTQRTGSWGGTVNNTPVSSAPGNDAASFLTCDAWGARITTTLLSDLSEEERHSLAGHAQTCPACAELFRRYLFIEEFAGQLPQYPLDYRYNMQTSKKFAKQRTRKEYIAKAILPLIICIVCFTLLMLAVVVTH